jgi:hypothetical protein
MMEKLPPVEGSVACLTCGCGAHETMSMERLLGVGFGDVSVTKDGEHVYSENSAGELLWEGKDAEEAAVKEPDRDWRVHFYAPLYEAEYQRQGEKHWVLVRKGQGFA